MVGFVHFSNFLIPSEKYYKLQSCWIKAEVGRKICGLRSIIKCRAHLFWAAEECIVQ